MMKIGCCTVMWNRRDCGASEINHHQPHQRPVFSQRVCCVYGVPNQSTENTSSSIRITQFSSVQLLSCVWLFATPWITALQACLSITNTRSLPKLTSIESVMPSSHLILCCPLLLLPSIVPSIRVFSNDLALCVRWPKYWSFNFIISPSNEYLGLTAFRTDWLDLLAVQGPLRNLLQHHSSKHQFFSAQFCL